jgi:putative FmdB family regulatory protein
MPLYEYRCRSCDNLYQRIERVSEPSIAVCPECGGEARRLLGAPALQFKGSGWYVNDYGKGNGNGATPAETEKAAAAAESPAPSRPDKKNKPEKKSDAKVA